jgi:hypothetical protein
MASSTARLNQGLSAGIETAGHEHVASLAGIAVAQFPGKFGLQLPFRLRRLVGYAVSLEPAGFADDDILRGQRRQKDQGGKRNHHPCPVVEGAGFL